MSEAAALQRVYPLLQGGRFADAEAVLSGIVAQAPANAEAHFLLGMCRYQQGAAREALPHMRRAVGLAPGTLQFAVNFGYVLGETGELDEAERVLRGAISRAPRDPTALNALGITLQQAGRLEEALEVFERGIAVAPRDDGLHNNFGRTLRDAGMMERALAEIRTALALNPGNLMAELNLGNVLRDMGALQDAIAAYERAIAGAPNFNMALHNLGEALLDAGRADEALQAFGRAMRAAPAVGAHCQRFADTVGHLPSTALTPAERDLVARCVARDDVDLTGVAAAAFQLITMDPRIGALLEASDLSPPEFAARMASDDAQAALSDHFLLDLTARTVIPDARAERLLTAFRRASLERWAEGFAAGEGARWIAPLAALALQCFLNEYAFAQEEAERALAARLANRLGEDSELTAETGAALALVACYGTLRDVRNVEEIAERIGDPWIARLVRRQVAEPTEEARIAATLPTVTAIEDLTSRAVRAQYEENPYPRWGALPRMIGAQPLQQKIRSLFPFLGDADSRVPERPQMLIAGCGTGRHAVLAALLHPGANILAVDLSRASLAYAARRAAELGAANIEFAQADILEMSALEKTFEVIDCAGVLHHLRDPLAGWRVLRGLLAADGFMRIALYSELGREAVVAARDLIAERGFPVNTDGIRQCRQTLLALPDTHPARPVTESPDFWSLSGCRDLLFHVQEHRFTLPRLGEALDSLDMEFLGFEFGDPGVRQAYRTEFPTDEHARSLPNWTQFEVRHPDAFGAMYQFWARPRPGPS
ncbi:MAG: tetratricopeptide repeat protein [Betaproteobacteria bacterium]|nr:tetratricopeptide repeat protein [Betaproteobacteria bacterium]